MPTPATLETAAVIALLRRKAIPARRLAEHVETAGSAVEVLQSAVADGLFGVPEELDAELDSITRELDAWRAEGIAPLSVFDAAYPLNLRSVHDRPALLFVRGTLDEADATSVAVVGARKASELGVKRARLLSTQLADAGYVVVSGLAAGIDRAAHLGAIDAGGRTVAVIGTGLRHSYPAENAELQRLIGDRFAVVSQFFPEQRGARWTFPLRNAVMSGFALATVVVEASDTSGARIQARFALEHGRPVFLLKSLLEHEWAREDAQRPGVYVAESTDDVVSRLRRMYPRELIAAS